jgi:phosphoglycerol transferase MdoB-like AlkP superfamily enzyme
MLPFWWCIAVLIIGGTLIRRIQNNLQRTHLDVRAPSTFFPSLKVKGHTIWLCTFCFASSYMVISNATHVGGQPSVMSLWTIQPNAEIESNIQDETLDSTFSQLRRSLGLLGKEYDSDFPFCEVKAEEPKPHVIQESPRSVVFLLIESLSNEVLDWDIDGQAVTPHLRRMRDDHWSHPQMMAAGTKSRQALHAIFSSVPEQPAYPLLYREPLNNLPGLPHALATAAYQTAYLYSGDLAFDHQNEYFSRVGFHEKYGLEPEDQNRVFGWGYSDKEIFSRARQWIKEKKAGKKPYFLSVATTATHHPYTLPKDAYRRFKNQSADQDRANAWANLDHELNRFLVWLDNESVEPAPYVFVTGDHVGHDINARHTRAQTKYDYSVPFIVTGLHPKPNALLGDQSSPIASHIDIAPTILGLVGANPLPCAWGRNLLAPFTEKSSRTHRL